jgi:hypothetical protein
VRNKVVYLPDDRVSAFNMQRFVAIEYEIRNASRVK